MCFPMALRPSSADHDAVSPSPNHLFPESDSDGAEGHDIELTAASPEKQADLPAFIHFWECWGIPSKFDSESCVVISVTTGGSMSQNNIITI